MSMKLFVTTAALFLITCVSDASPADLLTSQLPNSKSCVPVDMVNEELGRLSGVIASQTIELEMIRRVNRRLRTIIKNLGGERATRYADLPVYR